MSGASAHLGGDRAPLLGENLVRLLYLDEAGSDHKAPALVVAGVLVHGDQEWPEIDRRIGLVAEKYIPQPDRLGFVFHATDIFHGSKYFHKHKSEWPKDRRFMLLGDLATIIAELHLPILAGGYQRDGSLGEAVELSNTIHNLAAMDCLLWADRWLARFAPKELATVVHEDGTPAKRMIKHSVQFLRNEQYLEEGGVNGDIRAEYGLPLKRIIDTVHFADKPGARPLQLADLCAFILGRVGKDLEVPKYVFDVIWHHLKWMAHPSVTPAAVLGTTDPRRKEV